MRVNENTDGTNVAAGGFSSDIRVVLVAQHSFTTGADPYGATLVVNNAGAANEETDCSSLLTKFNEWGRSRLEAGELVPHDNRVLLSGRDFDGTMKRRHSSESLVKNIFIYSDEMILRLPNPMVCIRSCE